MGAIFGIQTNLSALPSVSYLTAARLTEQLQLSMRASGSVIITRTSVPRR
jgi:hypothetical protein